MTLGGEGLVSGLPDAGVRPGFSNGGAGGDSDGEGDGEADFDGRTRRAGSSNEQKLVRLRKGSRKTEGANRSEEVDEG